MPASEQPPQFRGRCLVHLVEPLDARFLQPGFASSTEVASQRLTRSSGQELPPRDRRRPPRGAWHADNDVISGPLEAVDEHAGVEDKFGRLPQGDVEPELLSGHAVYPAQEDVGSTAGRPNRSA